MKETNQTPPNAVIIKVKPTDFIAGGETGIALTMLEVSGQYDTSLPDEETQYDYKFDTYGCVSFSANNCLEVATTLKVQRKEFTPENIQWLKDNGYIDYRTGKINFSDRFLAKMSGTTKSGNSLEKVGDTARHGGLVPESAWPWPKNMTQSMSAQKKWDLYYAEPPQEVKDLGKEFERRFEVNYQWIIVGNKTVEQQNQIIKAYLPYGPIQIAADVCAPWNSTENMPPIPGCGCGTQHATIIYGYKDGIAKKDFDHYRSYRKLLDWNYCTPYAMQFYITEKNLSNKPTPPSNNFALGEPANSSVRALQEVLQFLNSPTTGLPYMKAGVFGPFGPQTQAALASFQVDNGIPDLPQGRHYGPKTRARMVQLLANL